MLLLVANTWPPWRNCGDRRTTIGIVSATGARRQRAWLRKTDRRNQSIKPRQHQRRGFSVSGQCQTTDTRKHTKMENSQWPKLCNENRPIGPHKAFGRELNQQSQ